MADRYRDLVASARDLIAAVDQAGCLTYVSPAIQQTLGLTHAEVVGGVLWEFVHPGDVAAVHGMLHDLFADGRRRSIEFQLLDAAGRWRRLEASVGLVDASEPAEAMLTAVDVTEQRLTDAALRQRAEQLRQARKMEIVGRLAGGISHDFGNLLTIIVGASGHLIDGLPADSPLHAHAWSIQQTAERAAAMVRQLLGFSRQRTDPVALVDLNEVVREAEQLLGRLLGEHIDVRTRYDRDLRPVRADRTRIEQVLLNLAVNARDAMPAGEVLTIETRNVPAVASGPGAPGHGPSVAVSVSDTGVGMDAAAQARAFEPFFTTKAPGTGTGLGLATVQDVAIEGGGWTELSSVPGRGTVVTFALPCAEGSVVPVAPASGSLEGAAPRPLEGGSETLLLVEDEAGVRELVHDMLEMAGYRVMAAAVPSEAERISREFDGPIDMLVTDVVMPEMSGVELAGRLRVQRPALRVMYMSGFPEPTVGDGVAEAPGVNFISKPFDRRALLHCARRALDDGRER